MRIEDKEKVYFWNYSISLKDKKALYNYCIKNNNNK